jgi:hypothetical protein
MSIGEDAEHLRSLPKLTILHTSLAETFFECLLLDYAL